MKPGDVASTSVSVQTAVERLVDARSSCRVLAPLSETFGEFTLEHAYAIQDALRAALDQRGEQPIGWKLGATSQAGQAVMGVNEPASGFLLPGQYASGAEVSVSGFADLRVEAEVAFRMRTTLVGPGVTAATALLAVEGAVPALELLDFMFSGTPRAADFIANRTPKYLGYFERVLERNPQGDRHLVGRRVSYCDLSLFQLVAGLHYAFPRAMARMERSFPRVIALHDRIAARPRVDAYLHSARRIAFNEHGIFRHYPELDAAS